MILIYNNHGILIPVFVVVPFIGTIMLVHFLKNYFEIVSVSDAIFQITMEIGLLISFIWTYLTSYDYVINDGVKERIEIYHHFFIYQIDFGVM
ncbi:hypothetical protein [uncultured Kordia sp.]|uniref:hypothetical protein n=1 Tax=uncultured Kordia sp. TaxID=507699 RepID=UPI002638B032|nr:hypothetical protein [uncultured Kordia sp.]